LRFVSFLAIVFSLVLAGVGLHWAFLLGKEVKIMEHQSCLFKCEYDPRKQSVPVDQLHRTCLQYCYNKIVVQKAGEQIIIF